MNIMQHLEAAQSHINSALALIKGSSAHELFQGLTSEGLELVADQLDPPERDAPKLFKHLKHPEWFEPNSRNLSAAGKTYLREQLTFGRRHSTIAAEMKIDQSAVSYWASKWGYRTAREQRELEDNMRKPE